MTPMLLACLLALHRPPPPPKPCPVVMAEERGGVEAALALLTLGPDGKITRESLEAFMTALRAHERDLLRCGWTRPQKYGDDGDQKNPPQVEP